MSKKYSKIATSSLLSVALLLGTTNIAALAEDSNDSDSSSQYEELSQTYLKIIHNGKVLFHDKVALETVIQTYNAKDEIIDSQILKSEKELVLETPELSKDEMLSYWKIEEENMKVSIKPVIVEKEEFEVKFLAEKGGNIVENNAKTSELIKSVEKESVLADLLPETLPNTNFKFSGWYYKNGEKVEPDKVKITDSKQEIFARFYQDYNDNEIDDLTENIKVKFVTKTKDKIDTVKLKVGQKIKAPQLRAKDKVFLGWYVDKNFETEYNNTPIAEDTTLYAKWEKADKVIEQSETKPITKQDVAEQVEQILKERENNSQKDSDKKESTKKDSDKKESTKKDSDKKESTKKDSDKKESTKKDSDKKESTKKDSDKKESTKKDSDKKESTKKDSDTDNSVATKPAVIADSTGGGFNNTSADSGTAAVGTSAETTNSTESTENKDTEKNEVTKVEQPSIYRETVNTYKNPNVGKKFSVKFFDENGSFLFSLTLPYGRTIQVYDQNKNKKDEYSVRQDSSITLNSTEYVNADSVLLNFESSQKRKNSVKITEVYPKAVAANVQETTYNSSEKSNNEQSNSGNGWLYGLAAVAAIALGGAAYWLIRKKKLAN